MGARIYDVLRGLWFDEKSKAGSEIYHNFYIKGFAISLIVLSQNERYLEIRVRELISPLNLSRSFGYKR